MFRDYRNFFTDANIQHNIMALVGNGFDVAAMNHYGYGRMKGKKPTYAEFYKYISYYAKAEELESNMIYRRMTAEKGKNNENWSDFELIIDWLITSAIVDHTRLCNDLDYIRNWFSKFLNDLLPAETMIAINNDSMEHRFARNSYSKFLGDLDPDDLQCLKFRDRTNHYDVFNFLFVDFNYTMLLDNYLYLDRVQFDPYIYKNVDRHFDFYPSPSIPATIITTTNENTSWSSYLITDIVHPHGYMDIPRSMIFDTELEKYNPHGSGGEKMFVKSHWARDEIKYSQYFNSTELFIIYGMSITKTDAWWFDHIYERLLADEPELIIYFYNSEIKTFDERDAFAEDVKNKFVHSCIHHGSDMDLNNKVKDKISVVVMKSNNTYFLGFKK